MPHEGQATSGENVAVLPQTSDSVYIEPGESCSTGNGSHMLDLRGLDVLGCSMKAIFWVNDGNNNASIKPTVVTSRSSTAHS